MKNIFKFLIISFLFVSFSIKTNSAEILQINSSSNILVGDHNRNLSIRLVCVNIHDNNEQEAINLLKKEFPRGSRIKIKPIVFKEDILFAKVFNINETKEMTDLLISKNLTKENCQN